MSAEVSQDTPPYRYDIPPIYRYPIGAQVRFDNEKFVLLSQTSFFDQYENYRGIPYTDTISQIYEQLAAYGYCAVMLHAQEYTNYNAAGNNYDAAQTVNATSISNLKLLLSYLQANNFQLLNLGQLKQYAP